MIILVLNQGLKSTRCIAFDFLQCLCNLRRLNNSETLVAMCRNPLAVGPLKTFQGLYQLAPMSLSECIF